ncbi:MAG: AMIN domain-containing protein [Endomicrobia bacterium]|nr:AMIN domain-containing protein [Endomicrobiia bacterium]
MKKNLVKILLIIFCFFISYDSLLSQTTENNLTSVEVYESSVVIICSQKPVFTNFFLELPPRIVVDIKNCELKLDKESLPGKGEYIQRVRINQFKKLPQKVARVVLDLMKKQNYEVSSENNIILVKLSETKSVQQEQQTTEKVTPKKEETAKSQDIKTVLPKIPVTIECVDAEIQDVLQMLAVKSGVNIIYGPDVTGKITINLKNVPFDKAFENILRISKLVYVPVGDNIVRVGTPDVIEQERRMQVMYTKIFPLNYAVADDVKSHLDQILRAEGRTKGMITVDQRTNSLIVTESEEGLKYVEEWIKKLDTKPYQVSIEAQVIDISVDDLSQLGVQWGVRSVEKTAGTEVQYKLNSAEGGGITISEVASTAKEIQSSVVNLPTSIDAPVFIFGRFTDALAISAKLTALITQGKAKVLSNPRVTTLNNKTAIIIAGEKIPYKSAVTQTSAAGGTLGQTVQETWDYITAGIQLTVTPTVSPDGWVTLNVKPQVDIPQIAAPGVPPTVKSRQTEVTVMVRNNEPLVIGGLISDSDIESIRKLPLLGDLPILGYLFKYKTTTKKRTELIILITPRIVEG